MHSSIIIPTKDRQKDIVCCLNSILEQTILPDEVVIVDQSTDQEIEQIINGLNYSKKLRINYIRSSPGLTKARNIGVKQSNGEIIIFLDDDIILEKDFVKYILKVFDTDKAGKVGGVSGRVINEDATKKYSLLSICSRFTLNSYPGDGGFRTSGRQTIICWSDKPAQVQFLAGCVSAYRRKVFEEFQFDENLKGYCYGEDADFSYRVSRVYECRYEPKARAFHNKSGSRVTPEVSRDLVLHYHYFLHKNIIRNKPWYMRYIHYFSFYFFIFSFTIYTLITARWKCFRSALDGFFDIVSGKSELLYKLKNSMQNVNN